MANPVRRLVSWLGSLVRGGYDAAQTSDENREQWRHADSGSVNTVNDPGSLRTMRDRAREECRNNPVLLGLVRTLSHDMVGTGARLFLSLPKPAQSILTGTPEEREAEARRLSASRRAAARIVSRHWRQWAEAIGLADKLRVMHESRVRDGECFGLFTTRLKNSPTTPVLLNLRLVEADQVTTPFGGVRDPLQVDGIRYDAEGDPVSYDVLRYHPGGAVPGAFEADAYPAHRVVHWFRPSRPGQARGESELAPSLETFAEVRRYGKAVLSAAEIAASFAGVLKSNLPVDDETPEVKRWDKFPITRGMLLSLPAGYEAEQFDAIQPTSNYGDFCREKYAEAGRCLGVTLNVVSGNSSGYNYSSGRLDHVIYHRAITVERRRLIASVLDPLFRAWLAEAILIPGFLPGDLPPVSEWDWGWYFDGFASIDPLKDASASREMLDAGLTTLAEEYAAYGQDWEEQLEQRAAERERMAELGLEPPENAARIQPVEVVNAPES